MVRRIRPARTKFYLAGVPREMVGGSLYRALVCVPAASASDRTYLTIYRCLTKPGLEARARRAVRIFVPRAAERARAHARTHASISISVTETVGERFAEPSSKYPLPL